MKTLKQSLYDFPRYYDLVYGSHWQAEYHFLREAFRKHGGRRKVRTIFEPACGTARLLVRFAKDGYETVGLDLNPKAVAYANARLKRHGQKETVFVADMANFQLDRPADVAFNTINSFRHLQTEAQARGHLRCMAGAIVPGGLYVLGMHLTPTEAEPMEEERWAGQRGHLAVQTTVRTVSRDLKSRREHCRMTVDVQSLTDTFRIVNDLIFRMYTARQMEKLIASVPEWEVVETYDFAYNVKESIEIGPEIEDVIYVLRRRK